MRFIVQCWNCGRKYSAHDELAAAHDYICPRCGMGARKIVFTEVQVAAHTPYLHLGEAQVCRVGLERRYFGEQGLYIKDRKNKLLQRYDQGVVNGRTSRKAG